MNVDAISIGNHPPEDINVIIEVPIGGQPIKYELDKDSGTLVVDRFLYTPMAYPGKWVKIGDWKGIDSAKTYINQAIERATKQ